MTNEEFLEIEENKKLIERYPFLRPQKVFFNELEDDYDYTTTFLDGMPQGWKKSFAIQMCEELREELIKHNYLDEYRLIQVKEKFGGLRWYDCGFPIESKIDEIINKYEELSEKTCIVCGERATKLTKGWICPFCDKCFEEYHNKESYVAIK